MCILHFARSLTVCAQRWFHAANVQIYGHWLCRMESQGFYFCKIAVKVLTRCFLSFLPRLSAKSHFTWIKIGLALRDIVLWVFLLWECAKHLPRIVLLNNFPLVYEKSKVSDFLPLRVLCFAHYTISGTMAIYFFFLNVMEKIYFFAIVCSFFVNHHFYQVKYC